MGTEDSTEHTYVSECYAHSVRRALIDSGKSVSLIAYDPNREMFAFDVY